MKPLNNPKLQKELKYIHNRISNHRFEEAENAIENLMFEYENDYRLTFEIGFLKYEQRQFDESYSIFEQLKSKQNSSYAIYYMAKIELLRENYDQADELFQIIINNNYKNKNYALLELAKLEKYKENYDKALKYIKEIDEEEIPLKNAKIIEEANIYYKQEKYEESNKIISNIIKEITEKKLLDKALTTMALNYLKLQQYDESLKVISRICYETSQTKLIKAKDLYFQNKYISCKKILDEIINNPSKSRDINIFETNLYLAKTYMKMGQNDEALKILEPMEEQYNELRYIIGVAYFKKQDLKTARNKFMQVKDEDFYKKDAIKQMIFLDIKEKKYEDAYKKYLYLLDRGFFEKNEASKNMLQNIYTFLSSKINIPKLNNNLYSTKQIYNYQYSALKTYIQSQKNVEMDIDEYIKIIKSQLNEETYSENNLFDHYIIENPEKRYFQDYLKVATIPNTKNILYVHKCDQFGYDAYERNETNETNIKLESQIEKFNKRYAKKLK